MGLAEVRRAIRSAPTTDFTQFRVPRRGAPGFVPEETYLEVRLTQMRLSDKRELWRTFVPILSVMTRSLYDGVTHTVPALIGPQRFEELLGQGGDGGRVEFRDLRLAGPLPYNGDDVELLVCLSRTATGDWAKRALGMVESIAKAVDLTKLSTSVSVAGPIVSELEKLLGMSDVENRLAVYRNFLTPDPGTETDSALAPGHLVLIREAIDPETLARMSPEIRDGTLYCTGRDGQARPFVDADFVVIELRALASRPDASTFGFHRVGWKKVQEHIWGDRPGAARVAMGALAAELMVCVDITAPDRRRLLARYKQSYDEAVADHGLFTTDHGFVGSSTPLDDRELARTVETAKATGVTPRFSLDPDVVVAELQLA